MSGQSKKTATDSGGSSEYDSESEEEGTKGGIVSKEQEPAKQGGEEEEEEEEESETDSDNDGAARYDTVKRDVYSGAPLKVSVADNPAGKRGRDVNGGNGAPVGEEPANKKRKEVKDEKVRIVPVKPSSPGKGDKGVKIEPATKGIRATVVGKTERGKAIPAAKGENAKSLAASRKRKASPPLVSSSRQQPRKGDGDKSSPMKGKKTANWSTTLETALVNLLFKDKTNGLTIPVARIDPYWEKLFKRLQLEGEMTELQLFEKVKRMRSRYNALRKRLGEDEGGKHFKSSHEERIFRIWEGIWGSGAEPTTGRATTSQPATEEDDSEDESGGQLKGDESSSEEDDEDEAENVKKRTAGLNQINAAGKMLPGHILVSPFISKPRLEFTPLIKDDKRKLTRRGEEVNSGDHHTGDVLAGDDGRRVDVNYLTSEHLRQLRAETLTFFQEIRGNCFQLVEEIRGDRFGSIGGAGLYSFGRGLGNPGMLDGLVSGSGSPAALKLQKKFREHKVRELALLAERLQLLQEQCRLQQEELKLQNQKEDQQEKLK